MLNVRSIIGEIRAKLVVHANDAIAMAISILMLPIVVTQKQANVDYVCTIPKVLNAKTVSLDTSVMQKYVHVKGLL